MSRNKKRRHTSEWVEYDEAGPTRKERNADPESYDSRRRKGLAERKKVKSVFQKDQDAKAANKGKGQDNGHARGRLADKIRKLNAEKATGTNS